MIYRDDSHHRFIVPALTSELIVIQFNILGRGNITGVNLYDAVSGSVKDWLELEGTKMFSEEELRQIFTRVFTTCKRLK